VVAWLIDELVALGHDVTLIASGDSRTPARLIPAWPRALWLGRPRTDPMAAQAALPQTMAPHPHEGDGLHSHIDRPPLPLLTRLGVPFLTTTHGRLDLPLFPEVVRQFPQAPFVPISDNQRRPLPDARWLGTVYHGLPADSLNPSFEAGTYLA